MSRLSISLLGPLQVWLDGKLINASFRTRKERALLAYLAIESRRSHRRDALGELFWPERPEGYARTNLRQALYGVRRALGDLSWLSFEGQDDLVRFDPQEAFELDTRHFLAHVEFTQTHVHRIAETCPACAGRWQAAIDLYRGDFMEDIALEDSQSFQEWMIFQREQYFRYLLQALRSMSDYFQRQGDIEQAYKYAWRYVSLAPLEEAAHRQLMSLMALSGERSAALEQYQTLRRLLQDELGVSPSAESQALYERIKAGILLDLSDQIIDLELTNLPLQLTPFFGRQDELRLLETYLTDSRCRQIALVGMPGVGKTRLAQQAARENIDRFTDGVWLVSLREPHNELQLQRAILQVVGLPLHEGQDLQSQFYRLLQPLKMLLVLDGFEYFTGDFSMLNRLAQLTPGIRLLMVSRQRVKARSVCTLELHGLAYPSDNQAADAQAFPAVQLFLNRAQQAWSGFSPNPARLEQVIEICRQVDGLPLALELAASRVRDFPLDRLLEEIKRGLDVLETNLEDIPAHQRSMYTVLESTWGLLRDDNRLLFETLKSLPDEFPAEAAHKAGGLTIQDLAKVVDHFLLQQISPGVYRIHPLVRGYFNTPRSARGLVPAQLEKEVLYRRTSTGSLKVVYVHDPVTQLPGRTIFWDRLAHMLARAQRYQQQAAVMLLEVDWQRAETEKAEDSDQIYQRVAQRVVSSLRNSDTVTRFDENQFAIILESLNTPRDALNVSMKVHGALEAPFEVNRTTISLSAHIGISAYPWDGSRPEELLDRAEKALHRAVQSGVCCYMFTGGTGARQ